MFVLCHLRLLYSLGIHGLWFRRHWLRGKVHYDGSYNWLLELTLLNWFAGCGLVAPPGDRSVCGCDLVGWV